MKFIFIILLNIIFLNLKAQSNNSIINSPDSIIDWDINKRLNWSDFKGIPDTAFDIFGFSTRAVSKPHIDVQLSSKNHERVYFNVVNYFQTYKSWTIDTTESILAHEQLHFDISELYARKIRKELEDLRNKGFTNLILYKKNIDDLMQQLENEQALYDSETLTGILVENQNSWNKIVLIELEKYRDYQVNYNK